MTAQFTPYVTPYELRSALARVQDKWRNANYLTEDRVENVVEEAVMRLLADLERELER